MANNTARYGLRWHSSLDGGCCPKAQELLVASAYQATVSATNVNLNAGDPVQFNVGAPGSGFIELAGAGGSPSIFYGVICGFSNVKVGLPLKGRKYKYLPGGTTWTTEENASKALVLPFGRNVWEVDVTGGSATSLTLYRAMINRCANLTYVLDTSDADNTKAGPKLDLSTLTDDSADFRIVGVSKTALNQDFTGTNVKLLVVVNESGEAPYVTDPGV
jgi:hypothetical protein